MNLRISARASAGISESVHLERLNRQESTEITGANQPKNEGRLVKLSEEAWKIASSAHPQLALLRPLRRRRSLE